VAGSQESVMQQRTGEALVLALSDAERRVTRRLAQVLAHHSCTVERWRALALLAGDESHDMSELAEFTQLPPASVTRLVDALVADNLAHCPSGSPPRATRSSATPTSATSPICSTRSPRCAPASADLAPPGFPTGLNGSGSVGEYFRLEVFRWRPCASLQEVPP
jgi:hypothetical protein